MEAHFECGPTVVSLPRGEEGQVSGNGILQLWAYPSVFSVQDSCEAGLPQLKLVTIVIHA